MTETVDTLKAQLQAKVKQYEAKLAALNAINSALQKENEQLRRSSDAAPSSRAEEELADLHAEFEQRLGAQQKIIYQLKEERARTEKALHNAAAGGSANEAKVAQLEGKLSDLRAEASAGAKRVGELEAANRKLTSQLRSSEAEAEKLKARCQAVEAEAASARQDAAAAAALAASKAQAAEVQLREAQAEARAQVAAVQQAAEKEIAAARAAAARGSEAAVTAAQEREGGLVAALAEARSEVQRERHSAERREEALRRELRETQALARRLESDKQELAGTASEVSKPLLKQIAALSSQLAAAQAAADSTDAASLERAHAAEEAAANAAAAQREAAARAAAAEAAVGAAKAAAAESGAAAAALKGRVESLERHQRALEAERAAAQERLAAAQAQLRKLEQLRCNQHLQLFQGVERCLSAQEVEQQRREASERQWESEHALRLVRQECDALTERLEAASSISLGQALAQMDRAESAYHSAGNSLRADQRSASFTSAHGGAADASGAAAIAPPAPAAAEHASVSGSEGGWSGVAASPFDLLIGGGGGGASVTRMHRTMERLRSELAAVTAERDASAEQLYGALQRVSTLQADVAALRGAREDAEEAARKLDVALELIGERTQRIEELEQDVGEMKQMFRAQLEEALAQVERARRGSV